MTAQSPSWSPNFDQVARGLVALHRLIREGKDESAEAESLRDALDIPLKALDEAEKQSAQWLSEDLYSISDPPAHSDLPEMQAEAHQALFEANQALLNHDWSKALSLLRDRQDNFSLARISYLRGLIWLESGCAVVAAEFFQNASRLDPTNASCLVMYLHALAESDPISAAELAEDLLAGSEGHDPLVVARAAEIRLQATRNARDTVKNRIYPDLIPILVRNKSRIEAAEPLATNSPAYAMTIGMIGMMQGLMALDHTDFPGSPLR